MKNPQSAPFTLVPGVVVDPRRGVLYMMDPGRAIDAVKIASGALAWSTTRAAKPLALHGDRLVAQEEPQDARALKIAVLDVRRGGTVLLAADVPLPDAVSAPIDQQAGRSFEARAHIEDGIAQVWWRFWSWRVSGLATRDISSGANELRGAALIDLKTGHVSPATCSGTAGERKPLDAGISADGRFAIASRSAGADQTGLPTYIWEIHSNETGAVVGKMPARMSMAPFFVYQGLLVYQSSPSQRRVAGKWIEEPLELRAFDLSSNSKLWARTLRDTVFRGALPPQS